MHRHIAHLTMYGRFVGDILFLSMRKILLNFLITYFIRIHQSLFRSVREHENGIQKYGLHTFPHHLVREFKPRKMQLIIFRRIVCAQRRGRFASGLN